MVVCGTRSGYATHYRTKTEVCGPCNQANKEYQQRWKSINSEKLAKYHAEYQKRNKDAVNAASRKWRANHQEQRKQIISAYWAANPDKRRENVRKRRAMRNNGLVEKYTEQEVLSMYGSDCHICLLPIDLHASRRSGVGEWEKGLHIDHLVPICNGGGDVLDNVRPAHARCNLVKNKFEIKEVSDAN